MAWASTSDVTALTGATATDAQILLAQGIVEMYADVTETADDNLSARDLGLLKKAVSYQTAFMLNEVEFFSRTNLESATQDGMAFKTQKPDSIVLSEPASVALSMLSWRRSGSIRTGVDNRRQTWTIDQLNRDEEPQTGWYPA